MFLKNFNDSCYINFSNAGYNVSITRVPVNNVQDFTVKAQGGDLHKMGICQHPTSS